MDSAYKGGNLHQWGVSAFYQDNNGLVNGVNQQSLSYPLVCLGMVTTVSGTYVLSLDTHMRALVY